MSKVPGVASAVKRSTNAIDSYIILDFGLGILDWGSFAQARFSLRTAASSVEIGITSATRTPNSVTLRQADSEYWLDGSVAALAGVGRIQQSG